MRRLFLLLLLLNIVFFAWQIGRSPAVHDPYAADIRPDSRQMQGVRTIYLLSEVGRKPRTFEPTAAAQPETPAPEPQESTTEEAAPPADACYRLGPFNTRKRAATVAAQLGEQGVDAVLHVEDHAVATMYWVSLPPFDTFDAAKQQLAELQQRGVEDLGIVSEPPNYVVSLGFYRLPGSAQTRIEEITALGYRPRTTERVKTRQTWWLDYRLPADQPQQATLWHAVLEAFENVSQQPRDCPAPPPLPEPLPEPAP